MKFSKRVAALTVATGMALSMATATTAEAAKLPSKPLTSSVKKSAVAYKKCVVKGKLSNTLNMHVWKVKVPSEKRNLYYLYPVRKASYKRNWVSRQKFVLSHFTINGRDTYGSAAPDGSAWIHSTRSGQSQTIYAKWKVYNPYDPFQGDIYVQCGVRL